MMKLFIFLVFVLTVFAQESVLSLVLEELNEERGVGENRENMNEDKIDRRQLLVGDCRRRSNQGLRICDGPMTLNYPHDAGCRFPQANTRRRACSNGICDYMCEGPHCTEGPCVVENPHRRRRRRGLEYRRRTAATSINFSDAKAEKCLQVGGTLNGNWCDCNAGYSIGKDEYGYFYGGWSNRFHANFIGTEGLECWKNGVKPITFVPIIREKFTNGCGEYMTAQECEDYAKTENNMDWGSVGTNSNIPKGCYYRPSQRTIYYNNHAVGRGNGNIKPVCKGR